MGSIVNGIGSLLGHNSQKVNAQKSVSDYQNAVQWSNQASQNAFNNETQAYQPLYNTGVSALNSASAMLQPGNNFQTSDPSYQWRLGQGLNAVQSSAAANGSLNSGGTLKALNNYAQGAASQEFQNQFNRQNTLAGYAQPAATGLATANASYANNQQNAFFSGANGMAGARTAQGNATAAQYGDGANIIGSVGHFFGF
jgi:hypothetical protein